MKKLSLVVARKELKDHLRDRRSLASALLFPLLGPLIFGVMFNVIASWNRQDKQVELPVVGQQNAPNLITFLKRSGVAVQPPVEGYERKIQDGKLDAVL